MATGHPQRIIITGASSGIGAALARLYASKGATLGLMARRKSELDRLAASFSCRCDTYSLDVRDADAVARAARHFIAEHGCPDAVIANAGISVGTLTDHADDTAVFRDVIDTNLIGMVNTFQPFLAAMRAANSGRLVGIASVAGYRGLPGASAYSASKAAVISYLESLRVELRGSGLGVLTICPGFIETPLTEKTPYPMPFLMSADTAARKIAGLVERGRNYTVIPWQMAIVACVLRMMPNWLYDPLLAGRARKPRRGG